MEYLNKNMKQGVVDDMVEWLRLIWHVASWVVDTPLRLNCIIIHRKYHIIAGYYAANIIVTDDRIRCTKCKREFWLPRRATDYVQETAQGWAFYQSKHPAVKRVD